MALTSFNLNSYDKKGLHVEPLIPNHLFSSSFAIFAA